MEPMTIYDQDYLAELQAEQAAQAGVKDPVAVDQSAPQQVAEELPLEENIDQVASAGNEIESDKEMNFKAIREELKAERERREKLERELEDYRYQNQRAVQREPETPRKRAIDDIKNDDLVTGEQFRRAMEEREAEYQLLMGEVMTRSQHPDYDEVISTYGVPLIQNEPDLAAGFQGARNKAAYLYKIGKMAMMSERHKEPEPVAQAPQPSKTAQRIVENSKKPGTLSNAVGGQAKLSQAEYYAQMSDADFHAMVQKNLLEV